MKTKHDEICGNCGVALYDEEEFCSSKCAEQANDYAGKAMLLRSGVSVRSDGETRISWWLFKRAPVSEVVEFLEEHDVCLHAFYDGPGRWFSPGPRFRTRGSSYTLVLFERSLDV